MLNIRQAMEKHQGLVLIYFVNYCLLFLNNKYYLDCDRFSGIGGLQFLPVLAIQCFCLTYFDIFHILVVRYYIFFCKIVYSFITGKKQIEYFLKIFLFKYLKEIDGFRPIFVVLSFLFYETPILCWPVVGKS